MAYTKVGPWSNGAPPNMSEENLDQMETQYDEAVAQAAILVAAIPEDPIAATAGERTLGTGAQQAAAGDHIHAQAVDDTDTEASTGGDGTSRLTYTEKETAVPDTSELIILTKTLTLSEGNQYVYGHVAGTVYNPGGGGGAVLVRLYIDGNLVDSQTIGPAVQGGGNINIGGSYLVAGASAVVKTVLYHTHGSNRDLYHILGMYAAVSKRD